MGSELWQYIIVRDVTVKGYPWWVSLSSVSNPSDIFCTYGPFKTAKIARKYVDAITGERDWINAKKCYVKVSYSGNDRPPWDG